ncbi:MAG: AAA family ATPase, partial [Dehalococcoidia bacterium]
MVATPQYGANPSPWLSQEISVFTPSAPINTVTLFRGRSLQMRILTETVKQIGQHAIIYGERGVGKTSLVSVLFKVVGDAVRTRTTFARVNCDVEDTFESLWRKVFRELPLNERGQVTELQRGFNEPTATLADRLGANVSPDDIRRLSSYVDGHLIVIIDEFDQMTGNQEAVRLVANTIKTLSDRRAPVTLILVGVADTVSQLISEHESVERNLVQVRMPRMSNEEIGQIISEGLASLNISIDSEQLAYACSLAQGLPVAAHRIGLQLAYR